MVAPVETSQAAALPRANVRQPEEAFSEELFHTVPNVAVFKEHQTVRTTCGECGGTVRGGACTQCGQPARMLRISRNELAAIAERCNRRIRETGDYAALTIGHTPSPDEAAKGAPQPEVVGFAGPFRLGVLGQPGQRQLYAILADCHIYRDKTDVLRKYPRRSPELWLEDRYEEMFLDPIALLGAEAPRLDMGLLYAAVRHGRLCEKYAAASPAAGSVFIPTDGDKDKTYYAAGESPTQEPLPMALSPEDVRQIVDALEQLDWVQFVKQQMSQGPHEAGETPAHEAAEEAGKPPASPAPPSPPPAAPPHAAPPAAAAPPATPAAAPPHPPAQGHTPPAAPAPAKPPVGDQKKEKLAAGCHQYSAEGSAEGDQPEKPGTASVTGVSDQPSGQAAEASVAGPLSDEEAPAKYARILSDQQALKQEITALRDQLAREKGARTFAERYARLSGLRDTLVFDLDEEAELARDMGDEQFEKYAASLKRNCQRMPIFHDLPTAAGETLADAPDRPGSKTERERFSRDHSERALKYCKAKAAAGESVSYEQVLADLRAGKTLPE